MQTINPFRLYEIGAKLHEMFSACARANVAAMFVPLTDAQKTLDAFIKGDPMELTGARPDAVRLLTAIGTLFDKYFIDVSSRQVRFPVSDMPVDAQDMLLLKTYLDKFEQALAAELTRQLAYRAEKRGIYSTLELMENACGALPKNLQVHVPMGAQHELNEAGRAMGFGLGTAAAIHILRATEIVTQKYYECFSNPLSAKAERNFATYLKKLQTLAEGDEPSKPDERLVALLVQLKDRYRVPLLQPDYGVDVDDATMLFGMAVSGIAQMVEIIRVNQPTERSAGARDIRAEAVPTPAQVAILADDEEDTYDFKTAQSG